MKKHFHNKKDFGIQVCLDQISLFTEIQLGISAWGPRSLKRILYIGCQERVNKDQRKNLSIENSESELHTVAINILWGLGRYLSG